MVDPATGRRIEQSLAGTARLYALDHLRRFPEHGATVMPIGGEGGGLAVWGSEHGAPNVSRAFAMGTDGPVTAADLTRVEELYARRGAEVRIGTSPWTHPSLFALLAARGYVVSRFDNLLTRLLGGASDVAPSPRDPDPAVTIARVTAGEEVAWGRVVRAGFGMDPADTRADSIDAAFEGSSSAQLFLATAGGEPAGGAGLVIDGGVGFLFATSTLPAFRRRGIHAALVNARLAHARAAGVDLAVVVTDPGSDSQRNLETRCGFRVGYTQMIFTKFRN